MERHTDLAQRLNSDSVICHWNNSAAELVEFAVQRGEGRFSSSGALVANTGVHTGRSPQDRYIVKDDVTANSVDWGKVNQAMSPQAFALFADQLSVLEGRDTYFVQDLLLGAEESIQLKVRVICEQAWHALFAQNMFIVPTQRDAENFEPDWVVLHRPSLDADHQALGVRSETCVALDFSQKMVCVAGTEYAGEIKKSMFSVLNFTLPEQEILPMHCSANVSHQGESALFFGLSGTGKTTLSADPNRPLIGDDEHGWGPSGVFNFEGGCYAKVIGLTQEKEPEIWAASHRFGAVLENVPLDSATRAPDFDDTSLTENTRVSYPIEFIDHAIEGSKGDAPNNIIFLTADAYGVLPALCKLSPAEAVFHFLSGYTAKVAGTEKGLGKEPQATFSACFGAPFMPRHPMEYAKLLRKKIEDQGAQCWLLNTGWVGGKPGVGSRFPLKSTRQLLTAVLQGQMASAPTAVSSAFGFTYVTQAPEVDSALLDPAASWDDQAAYSETAEMLWSKFVENFAQFEAAADEDVLNVVGKGALAKVA